MNAAAPAIVLGRAPVAVRGNDANRNTRKRTVIGKGDTRRKRRTRRKRGTRMRDGVC